jgi:hypothetical protein
MKNKQVIALCVFVLICYFGYFYCFEHIVAEVLTGLLEERSSAKFFNDIKTKRMSDILITALIAINLYVPIWFRKSMVEFTQEIIEIHNDKRTYSKDDLDALKGMALLSTLIFGSLIYILH